LHENCVNRIREIAKSDFPTSTGEIAEELVVGIENSRAELEESFDSSGLCEEGPGGSGTCGFFFFIDINTQLGKGLLIFGV
jgi:hypothetical protein